MTSTPSVRLRAVLRGLLVCALVLPGPLAAAEPPVPSGPYLAARQAMIGNDFAAAARYYRQALEREADIPALIENAMFAYIGIGDLGAAAELAERLAAQGMEGQISALARLARDSIAGDYAAVVARYEAGASVSPLIDGMLRAWALAGAGRMSDALAAFDAVSADTPLKALALHHKALALAMVGDFEAAASTHAGLGDEIDGLGRGALRAQLQILSQLERSDAALARLDSRLEGESDPEFDRLRAVLAEGGSLPFETVREARHGMGQVLFALTAALEGEISRTHSLLFARVSQALDPGNVDILLQVADLLEQLERHELASDVYEQVPTDHPLSYTAEIGRADALFAMDKPDAAIEVLKALSRKRPDLLGVQITLGDALRRLERYAEAAPVYGAAIALLDRPQPRHWSLFYFRGIAHERTGEWEKAEADFRTALDLSPEQPLVLNYLGYSLVERRENLAEAQKMIETAVAARPDDGFITDSLGWVLYRLGKHDEAVAPMERAVALEPMDPIINDHLGDVYWVVGRRLEARFQWQRALSFDPEPAEAERIRRKLEIGLDAVLREEEAQSAAGNAN